MRARWIWLAAPAMALGAVFLAWTPHAQTPSNFTASNMQSPAPTADEEAGAARSSGGHRPPPLGRRAPTLRPPHPDESSRADAAPHRVQPQTAFRPAVVDRPSATQPPSTTQGWSSPSQPHAITLPATEGGPDSAGGPAAGEARTAEAPPAGLPTPILTPPVLLNPSPAYPSDAYAVAIDRSLLTPELRLLASEGRVVVRVFVRADGTVGAVVIGQSSGNPALDRAAVEAASSWRFQPATRDDVAVDAWAVIPVRFVLP